MKGEAQVSVSHPLRKPASNLVVIGILHPTLTLPAAVQRVTRAARGRGRGRGRAGLPGPAEEAGAAPAAHWLRAAGATSANQWCRGRGLPCSPGGRGAALLSGAGSLRAPACSWKFCPTLSGRTDPHRPAMGPPCRSLSTPLLLLLLQVRRAPWLSGDAFRARPPRPGPQSLRLWSSLPLSCRPRSLFFQESLGPEARSGLSRRRPGLGGAGAGESERGSARRPWSPRWARLGAGSGGSGLAAEWARGGGGRAAEWGLAMERGSPGASAGEPGVVGRPPRSRKRNR